MSRRAGLSGAQFDRVLTAALFVACEIEVIVALQHDHGRDHWPTAANVAIVAGLTIPLLRRRTRPLASAIAIEASVVLLILGLADVATVNFPQLLIFIAPYSVAAYSQRRGAFAGLVACGALSALGAIVSPAQSSWTFIALVCIASWTAGRAIRARRATAAALEHTHARLASERSSHELLAVAEQRTRIARELQTLVAHAISTMIVQSQGARQLLSQATGFDDRADAAMADVEATGRQALDEMRRVLGALREGDTPGGAPLAPQPGVGQIGTLVDEARSLRPRLVLSVSGDPGPLPASVDISLYRILQEALDTAPHDTAAMEVSVTFRASAIELAVTTSDGACLAWPTQGMRERVALCHGTLDVVPVGEGERLLVTLPRAMEGALP